MRKSLLYFSIVIAVAWGIAAMSLRSRVAAMAPTIARQFATELGADVEIGDVRLSLLPLAAKVGDVRALHRESSGKPFLTVATIRLRIALLPLLFGEVEISDVVCERPRLEWLRQEDGRVMAKIPERFLAKLAARPFSLRLVDGSARVENRFDSPPSLVTAEEVSGSVLASADGVLQASLTGRVLGSSRRATLSLRLEPGVGPTGGDAVLADLLVEDATVAALKDALGQLRDAELHDPVSVSLHSEGFWGEKSTESRPAEPLSGKLTASMGLMAGGLSDRLELDLDLAVDDKRYLVRGGKGRWGGLEFTPAGWLAHADPQKMSIRLDFQRFAVEELGARFGFAERWRPRGELDWTIRVGGTLAEPLLRHEGRLARVEFEGWPVIPITAGPTSISGALLGVNTDISVSFNLSNLAVGTARFDRAVVGLSYWQDKLALSSMGVTVYEGNAHASVVFWPAVSEAAEGGILLRDADAESLVKNVAPRLPFGVSGRADTMVQLGKDESGVWIRGRMSFHRGRISGPNWMRELVAAAIASAEGADTAFMAVASAHAKTLADVGTRFRRVAMDFETRDGAVTLPRFVVEAEGAAIRAHGRVEVDGSVVLDGAFIPGKALAEALTEAVPALAGVKAESGAFVIPFSLLASAADVRLAPTGNFLRAAAAAAAGETVPPLSVSKVGPADYENLSRLRRQFGR